MKDLPHKTEILDWNEEVITVSISGVSQNLIEQRLSLYRRMIFDKEVEVVDIIEDEDSRGIVNSHIVTFKKDE